MLQNQRHGMKFRLKSTASRLVSLRPHPSSLNSCFRIPAATQIRSFQTSHHTAPRRRKMSDDEADPELLELLRQHLQGQPAVHKEPETGVLEGCEWIYDNCIDVALDMRASKRAAELIYTKMMEKGYSTKTWSEHELHPKAKDEATVNFIFTMDLLNFSFWSELEDEDEKFAVEYKGERWTGYWSLVASLQRALEEGIPVTDPTYWLDEEQCSLEKMKYIFRSCTEEEMPMIKERLDCLQEASQVLLERYGSSVASLIDAADGSAARLVNLLAQDFQCFRDEHAYEGRERPVRFLKRAQIFVADVWACFEGESYGEFSDIDKITMFADYRIPQILISLGALYCSPTVAAAIKDKKILPSGSKWEMQLRACSIWAVELIKRDIKRQHPETDINAILIDFYLYDTMKEMEKDGKEALPHHRTRSIWY